MLMIQKKAFLSLALVCVTSLPGYGQKAMMFNSVDRYIERAHIGIWIVEAGNVQAVPNSNPELSYRTVKVIKVLEGDALSEEMRVTSVFRSLIPGERYLLFGFSAESVDRGGGLMDNGNISPVPIPISFSLALLQGKSLKEQIELILFARIEEIDQQSKELAEEKKAITSGLATPSR